MEEEGKTQPTHTSRTNALGDLGAQSLAEGNVAFFKDAVEELWGTNSQSTFLINLSQCC